MYKWSTYSMNLIYCLPAMYNSWATLAMGWTSYHVMMEFQQVHWVRSAMIRPRSVVILGDQACLLKVKSEHKTQMYNCKLLACFETEKLKCKNETQLYL